MGSVKPAYLIVLALVILFVVFNKLSNPYRKYSTSDYWQTATLASVADIPDEALLSPNKNGPILMWAAIGSSDPQLIRELVKRGADVNESDGIFKGTPLTGAAGYSKNPEIISTLVELGADISKTVHGGETALMVAARYNKNPGIVTELISNGAKKDRKSSSGKTAYQIAKRVKNEVAMSEL